MNINRIRNSLRGIPSVIFGCKKTDKKIDNLNINLFSNFFIISINEAFLYYPQCNILVLNEETTNKHLNAIKSLRCIKVYSGTKNNPNLDFNLTLQSKNSITCGLDIALALGCSPILTYRLDVDKKRKVNNKILSMDNEDCKNSIDPFVAYSKYNDLCPDRLDIMKRLIK
ncbi:hypothetical protein CMI47_18320 [Candidatus Pacearchaeota archaeon]|nr:hypothetical protein [Candidatus Pacearchaeota archaeon]